MCMRACVRACVRAHFVASSVLSQSDKLDAALFLFFPYLVVHCASEADGRIKCAVHCTLGAEEVVACIK